MIGMKKTIRSFSLSETTHDGSVSVESSGDAGDDCDHVRLSTPLPTTSSSSFCFAPVTEHSYLPGILEEEEVFFSGILDALA
jgi:hypothetical protein